MLLIPNKKIQMIKTVNCKINIIQGGLYEVE